MRVAYDPNRQGWGFALVVCLLTAGLAFTAYTIHSRTYRHPRDPMNTQVYVDRDSTHAAEHSAEAAGGEHGGMNHGASDTGAAHH